MKKDIEIMINEYPFTIKFFKKNNEYYDGLTRYNERIIEIRDDVDLIATMLLVRHEITHAILCCQGRCYQKKFDVEEVCEFISYELPQINTICDYVKKILEDKSE